MNYCFCDQYEQFNIYSHGFLLGREVINKNFTRNSQDLAEVEGHDDYH
jgi:hypothetical protein